MMRHVSNTRAMVLLVLFTTSAASAADPRRVEVVELPDGGIQPQAVTDSEGAVHLVYLKGDPGKSNVYYARAEPGERSFSRPIRVNSDDGSAIAAGTIRGVQIAAGRKGRGHVGGNGSGEGRIKTTKGCGPMV